MLTESLSGEEVVERRGRRLWSARCLKCPCLVAVAAVLDVTKEEDTAIPAFGVGKRTGKGRRQEVSGCNG